MNRRTLLTQFFVSLATLPLRAASEAARNMLSSPASSPKSSHRAGESPAPPCSSGAAGHPARAMPQVDGQPDWLRHWQADQIIPILQSDCPIEQIILQGIPSQNTLAIRYDGGSSPGESRSISPILLFAKQNYSAHYLLAWCHQRKQARTFRIDAVSLL